MSTAAVSLYGTPLSGHCHRVEALLRLLAVPFRYHETPAEDRRSDVFRATLNPLGEIPVLVDGDLILPDSNAILVYLAQRYDSAGTWYPREAIPAAQVQRWLSVAAGEIRRGPCQARLIRRFGLSGDPAPAQEMARRILAVMDGHLADRSFLALSHPTIADLACYAYVAWAPEGGIDLDPYPHVRSWLARIAALPGVRAMAESERGA